MEIENWLSKITAEEQLYKSLWLFLTRSKATNFPDQSFQTKLEFHRKLSENLPGTDATVNSALTMREISRRQTLSNLKKLSRKDLFLLFRESQKISLRQIEKKRGTISLNRCRSNRRTLSLKAGIRQFPSKRFLEGWLLNGRSKRNFVTNGFYDIFNVVVEQRETGLGRPGCRPVTPAESRPAHTETALTFTR